MAFSKQLEKIKQGKLWRFFGGIKPNDLKCTNHEAIEELAIPSLITLPLDRHLGPDGQLLVQVGDYVKAGQPLTIPGGGRYVPLHASTSGEVTGINMQVLPHPSGFLGRCITIKPDGKDVKVPDQPMKDWLSRPNQEVLQRIREFGVEGLGGAQFQTAAKIGAAMEEAPGDCNIFIVNGAECEPVATCDDRLMQEKASEIAQGIEVVRKLLNPKVIIVAIEDNKPQAIKAMQEAVAPDVMVKTIPTLYPSGAARNLIKICTGIEIPYNEHTSECGIVVDNVETVYAIKQAVIDGIPLIKRVITIDGQTLGKHGNALVRLGTSVRFVLNAYKLNPERRQRIILGGPFMGFTLPTIDVPITKGTTCVYVPSVKEIEERQEQMNCIRCGRCARVCPSRLVPYQLYALSQANQHQKTQSCGMMDCTECGCCAYVCPSRIPLTHQFRKEKAIIRLLKDQQKRNERAQERAAARTERLKQEEIQKQKRREAALARAAAQKAENANLSPEELEKKRAAAVAAARARAAAKREAALQKQTPEAQVKAPKTSTEVTKESSEFKNNKITKRQEKATETTFNVKLETKFESEVNTKTAQVKPENNEVVDPALGDTNKVEDILPQALRKTNKEQHAPEIFIWPQVENKEPDLSIIEKLPAAGVYIPESKPRSRTYLKAPEEVKKELMKLPSKLNKDVDASDLLNKLKQSTVTSEELNSQIIANLEKYKAKKEPKA